MTAIDLDTSLLPDAIAEYLEENRSELVEMTETVVDYDTQNPPGRTNTRLSMRWSGT